MLGDGLSPTACVIGSPEVRGVWYPDHLGGAALCVRASANTAHSDSRIGAILNQRPEIHTEQHVKWRAFEECRLKPRATKMACGKLLDSTGFRPVEDCSRLH